MYKRAVYNGYIEKYMIGKEIKEFLKNSYLTFGRHHSKVAKSKFDFQFYPKIIDDNNYRVFYNEYFFKIMNAETDKNIYFFGYTNEKPIYAID